MALDFNNAIKRPVYWRMGTVKNGARARFIKAPYDVVILGGEQYVQPIDRGGSHIESPAKALEAILANGDIGDSLPATLNALSDNGFTDEIIFLDRDQAGNGTRDEWQSLQFHDVL